MDELSPSQFIAARALASAYNHLWSGVPDETYDLEDIIAWSNEHQHPSLPGGASTPRIWLRTDWDGRKSFTRPVQEGSSGPSTFQGM